MEAVRNNGNLKFKLMAMFEPMPSFKARKDCRSKCKKQLAAIGEENGSGVTVEEDHSRIRKQGRQEDHLAPLKVIGI